MRVDPAFWAGRRVLLTGHTGFKGSWMALWLQRMGAVVTGVALAPDSGTNLFDLAGVGAGVSSRLVDIRDLDALTRAVSAARPEVVLHLAAQPLVRRAMADPVEAFTINVGGTVHLLQALRACQDLSCVLVVTTDKVYRNDESPRAFQEHDRLGGTEAYGASKAAAELATVAFAQSYFPEVPVATARGGNVIGGGDFAPDRLVPDIVRAVRANTPLRLRNPAATRPWQHVLDCLAGYLCFAQALAGGTTTRRALNFGPLPEPPISVHTLACAMLEALGARPDWQPDLVASGAEAMTLAIDSTAARVELGWHDRLIGHAAITATAGWYRAWAAGADMRAVTLAQLDHYESHQETAE